MDQTEEGIWMSEQNLQVGEGQKIWSIKFDLRKFVLLAIKYIINISIMVD